MFGLKIFISYLAVSFCITKINNFGINFLMNLFPYRNFAQEVCRRLNRNRMLFEMTFQAFLDTSCTGKKAKKQCFSPKSKVKSGFRSQVRLLYVLQHF